jgi:hypothetical protein
MEAIIESNTPVTAPFKVDTSRGQRDGRVSSQWFSRPDDQRFLSLSDLADHVEARSFHAKTDVMDLDDIMVQVNDDNISLLMGDDEVTPNHWSFGQLCGLAGAPAGYLRQLPAKIAGINLQYGLVDTRDVGIKAYYKQGGELMAATGPNYGRVLDIDIVRAVQQVAGNGNGDTRWKVPGVLDWSNGTYNPFVDPSRDTTTLYASDRDVFIFLVDDTHPIEIGKLSDGNPDLVFRGFYVWNSEVGSKSMGISTFLLRGVCQNRNLWGQQDVQSMMIRHTKNAPERFASEVGPALLEYSNASDTYVINGINAAKEKVVAKSDDDRMEFLGKRGFTKRQAENIINTVVNEEGRKPESVWDFVQGITARARKIPHTDERVSMEKMAGDLLVKASK